MKLAYALCGSFCTHKKSLEILNILTRNHNITPILSEASRDTDTRFGRADTLRKTVEGICDIITRGEFDAVIVSPCTGNTLAKIANGITDSTVTMCVKAQARCRRPVVLGIASNDALGANLSNIAKTIEKKNFYFVPFGQDDPINKPTSLICDFSLIEKTLDCALKGIQIQPLLL